MRPFPPQQQLVMPLLEVLDAAGGAAKPADAIDALAATVAIPAEARETRSETGTATGAKEWDRHVRWVRQRAVLRGLIAPATSPAWTLTTEGQDALHTARPGLVVTVYETERGVALWAECESAVHYLEDGAVNLIVTSPPYPLLRKKAYGNLDAEAWLDWMIGCVRLWQPKLADDGSLVINLGDTWNPGIPTLSVYQETFVGRMVNELQLHLAQRLYWENPAKMPAPAAWVTVRRVRLTPSVEQVYWFSKTPHPKADNRRVLREYSAAMRRTIAAGGESAQQRPSGHHRRDGAFNGSGARGSIAHSLLTIANTISNSPYLRTCRARALPVHPARFPEGLAEFFVALTTTELDVVWDPFAGSGVTAAVCERLGRRWITSERSLAYVDGSATRFEDTLGFTSHRGPR